MKTTSKKPIIRYPSSMLTTVSVTISVPTSKYNPLCIEKTGTVTAGVSKYAGRLFIHTFETDLALENWQIEIATGQVIEYVQNNRVVVSDAAYEDLKLSRS